MKKFFLYLLCIILWSSCGSEEPVNQLFPFEENAAIPSNLSDADRSNLLNARGRTVASISLEHLKNMLDESNKGLRIYSFYKLDCEECLDNNLHLNKIAAELSDTALQVFYINLDKSLDSEKVTTYVRSKGITGWVFQLQSHHNWHQELGLSWDGALPAMLLVNQSLESQQIFQDAYSYGELYALIQPYL